MAESQEDFGSFSPPPLSSLRTRQSYDSECSTWVDEDAPEVEKKFHAWRNRAMAIAIDGLAWGIETNLENECKLYVKWANASAKMLKESTDAIICEFSSTDKAQEPHPIYRLMRYGTPVIWNGITYPNIEYALSEYRRFLETGISYAISGYIFLEEQPDDKKEYTYAAHTHETINDRGNSWNFYPPEVIWNKNDYQLYLQPPPIPQSIQRVVYKNKVPTKEHQNKLNAMFANLMNQVFFQYDVFHNAIMLIPRKIIMRSYIMTEVVHFKRLEIVRDAIRR